MYENYDTKKQEYNDSDYDEDDKGSARVSRTADSKFDSDGAGALLDFGFKFVKDELNSSDDDDDDDDDYDDDDNDDDDDDGVKHDGNRLDPSKRPEDGGGSPWQLLHQEGKKIIFLNDFIT